MWILMCFRLNENLLPKICNTHSKTERKDDFVLALCFYYLL